MEFRHISKLSQQNKSNKKNRSKSGGKVDSKGRNLMSGSKSNLGKDARYNMMNEMRKNKREEMIMKRRGLEFITEHHEENLDQESIAKIETEVDNVAPKVVALLALHSSCDIVALRKQLVGACIDHE